LSTLTAVSELAYAPRGVRARQRSALAIGETQLDAPRGARPHPVRSRFLFNGASCHAGWAPKAAAR